MEIFTCGVCFEEVSIEEVAIIECEHLYCRDCLYSYLTTEIRNKKIPIKCPDPSCYYVVEESELQLLLNPEDLTLYYNNSLDKVIDNTKSIIHCPKADCKGVVEVISRYFYCPICQYKMCINCNNDYHEKEECPEKEDIEFDKYVKDKHYMKCPNCITPIDRISGCNKITCKCGINFCYLCGKDITAEKYTHFNTDHVLFSPEHHPDNIVRNEPQPQPNNIVLNEPPNNVNMVNLARQVRELNIVNNNNNNNGCPIYLIAGGRTGEKCGGPIRKDTRFCYRHKEEDLNRPRYNPDPEAKCNYVFSKGNICTNRRLLDRETCPRHTR